MYEILHDHDMINALLESIFRKHWEIMSVFVKPYFDPVYTLWSLTALKHIEWTAVKSFRFILHAWILVLYI